VRKLYLMHLCIYDQVAVLYVLDSKEVKAKTPKYLVHFSFLINPFPPLRVNSPRSIHNPPLFNFNTFLKPSIYLSIHLSSPSSAPPTLYLPFSTQPLFFYLSSLNINILLPPSSPDFPNSYYPSLPQIQETHQRLESLQLCACAGLCGEGRAAWRGGERGLWVWVWVCIPQRRMFCVGGYHLPISRFVYLFIYVN